MEIDSGPAEHFARSVLRLILEREQIKRRAKVSDNYCSLAVLPEEVEAAGRVLLGA